MTKSVKILFAAGTKYGTQAMTLMRELGIKWDYEKQPFVSPHEYIITISENDFNLLKLSSNLTFNEDNEGLIHIHGPNGHEF